MHATNHARLTGAGLGGCEDLAVGALCDARPELVAVVGRGQVLYPQVAAGGGGHDGR